MAIRCGPSPINSMWWTGRLTRTRMAYLSSSATWRLSSGFTNALDIRQKLCKDRNRQKRDDCEKRFSLGALCLERISRWVGVRNYRKCHAKAGQYPFFQYHLHGLCLVCWQSLAKQALAKQLVVEKPVHWPRTLFSLFLSFVLGAGLWSWWLYEAMVLGKGISREIHLLFFIFGMVTALLAFKWHPG